MNVLSKLNDYGFRSEFKTSLLCLLFVVPAFNAQAIDVAVVERAGGGLGGGAAVVAQLNDDTFFDFTATLVDPSEVDSVASWQTMMPSSSADPGLALTRYGARLWRTP